MSSFSYFVMVAVLIILPIPTDAVIESQTWESKSKMGNMHTWRYLVQQSHGDNRQSQADYWDSFGIEIGGALTYTLNCTAPPRSQIRLMVLTETQRAVAVSDSASPCSGVSNLAAGDLEAVFKIDAGYEGQVDVTVDAGDAALQPGFYYYYLRECPQCNGNHCGGNSAATATVVPVDDILSELSASGDGEDEKYGDSTAAGISDANANGRDSSSTPAVFCTASISLTNAGGSHLSSDEVLMPETTRILVLCWMLALFAWLANWGYYYSTSNKLHDMLTLGPLIKLVTAIADFYEVRRQAGGGLRSTPLEDVSALFNMLSTSWFFVFCLFGVHGFCIVRYSAPDNLKMLVILPLVFLACQVMTEWIHNYFLALSIIAACVMVVNILRESGVHLHYLHVRLSEIEVVLRDSIDGIEQAQLDALTQPLLKKRFLMETIRICFVGYALLWAFLGIVKVYLSEKRYLEHLFNDVLWIVTWWFMMWVFRLRDQAMYTTKQDTGSGGDGEDDQDPQCSAIDMPGGQVSFVGVEVSNEQYHLYKRVMQRSVKTTKSRQNNNDVIATLRRRIAGLDAGADGDDENVDGNENSIA